MGRIRALLSITLVCVLAGVAGGLGLGYLLSRRGEWLVVQPWVIYAAALLIVTAGLTWFDLRRRPRMTAPSAAAAGTDGEPRPIAAEAGPHSVNDEGGVVE